MGKQQQKPVITSRGIGGSEITAIMGLDPYSTPYSVWERKTGRAVKFEGNKFTRAGQYLEDAIANMFSDNSGHAIYHIHDPEADNRNVEPLRHSEFPHLIGFVDRGVKINGKGDGILEIKNTLSRVEREDILSGEKISWYFQAQWYIGISGFKTGFIAWLVQGVDFDWVQIDFNEEIFSEMVIAGHDFWTNNVLADEPPPPIRREDIERMFGKVKLKAIEGPSEVIQYHQYIKENNEKIKELTAANEELKEAVQLLMLDNAILTFNGGTLFTWKQSETTRLDISRLKEEKPDIFNEYAKKTISRTFRIK